MALPSTSVLDVECDPPNGIVCVPGGSLRLVSVSDPGSFQTTALVLGLGACEAFACAL